MTKDKNFYALLIGIDRYEPNRYYKDLRGCVRDIDLVDTYIRKTLEVPQKHIWKLISPFEETHQMSGIRSAQITDLPTYKNIVDAFKALTIKAQCGEQVYIHYSGHGGRAKTIYPELEGKKRRDEGIVPMDFSSLEGNYLRDVEIATLLKRLTDKGCIVTMIFDSCHSGGATRGDYAIRGNENNETDFTERSGKSRVASRKELINNWKILTQADPEMSEGWLPNANDYVFLAACRPNEFAFEYAVDGNDRHGALTYWMINTLTSSTSVLTYQSLYDRVKGMVQSKFPQQLPMLMGNCDRIVFGDQRKYKPYTVTVNQVTKVEVTLDAGLAQGLSPGTRFAIYPFDCDDLSDRSQQIAIVELTIQIQADSAKAIILDTAAGGIEIKGEIQPGASAVMVTAPIDLIRKVQLFGEKQTGEKEQDLPAELVDQQSAALARISQALIGNGWVIEAQEGESSHFQVAITRDGTYEICIGMPISNLRPSLSIKDPDAPKKVVGRLVHLTKYQSVQALDNPASELTSYLEFVLCDKQKQPFPDPQNVTLKPGEVSYLKIKNNYNQILNVAVLDIEPTWEISQIPIQGDFASFFPLDPGKEAYTKLHLTLPKGYDYTKETLKILATKGLANFQWLLLPSLDEQPRTRANNLNVRLQTRSSGQAINPLNDLLAAIGSDLDNPPQKTRAMLYVSNDEAEWATQEINIVVK